MNKNTKQLIRICALLVLFAALAGFSACSKKGGDVADIDNPYQDGEVADLSAYEGMDDYDGEVMLVETTVAEAEEYIKDNKTFVLFMSFADCPYCNRLIPYLNEIAAERGIKVAYVDTRSNPEWMNNMDIDDYDVFAERFKKYLSKDDDGKPHLYTPDTYFIKKGRIVARHDGVTPGADDPSVPLTASQEEQLRKDLNAEFDALF